MLYTLHLLNPIWSKIQKKTIFLVVVVVLLIVSLLIIKKNTNNKKKHNFNIYLYFLFVMKNFFFHFFR